MGRRSWFPGGRFRDWANHCELATPRASHFYNGALRDAFGNPTTIRTYTLLGAEKIKFGDARLNARYRLPGMLRRPGDNLDETNANIEGKTVIPPKGKTKELSDRDLLAMYFKPYYRGSFVEDTDWGDQRCYDLGLALHYLTDITQPMHASTFDAFKEPIMLHAVFEEYVPTIQGQFPVTSAMRWEKENEMVNKPKSADETFDEVARTANALAPALMKVLTESPGGCWYSPEYSIDYDRRTTSGCFRDPSRKAVVEAAVGKVLQTTYQSVANYLWAAFNEEYKASELGKRCPIGTEWGNNQQCYQACGIGYKPTDPVSTYCVEACPEDGCKEPEGETRNPKLQKRLSVPAQIATL